MRHRKADKKLNRSYSLRKATMRDIAKSVIRHQSIKTTVAKAKESRKVVDHLITLGKRGDLHSRRLAFSILCDHSLVSTLFTNLAPRFSKINGGYTRIIPWVNRRGDNAQLAILELTVRDVEEKTKKKPKLKGADEQKPAVKQVEKDVKAKSKPEKQTKQKKADVVKAEEGLKPPKTQVKEVKKEVPKKEEQQDQKIADKQIEPEKPQKPEESQGKLLKGIRKFFKKD